MATQRGGPIFWIKENLVCPNRAKYSQLNDFDKQCLDNAPAGQECVSDAPANSNRPRTQSEEDATPDSGCERYHFISGRDEIALNSDIGLHLDFQVTDGIIHGCPGLEHFNETMRNTHNIVWSKLPGTWRAEPLCQKQMYAEPPGSQPTFEIMEEFAADQTTWINEYQATHEKMLRNGIPAGQLTQAPDYVTGTNCPLPRVDNWDINLCYEESPPTGSPFMVGNRGPRSQGKYLTMNPANGWTRLEPRASDSDYQLWQWSESGRLLLNLGTGLPMSFNGNVLLSKVELDDHDWILFEEVSGNALDGYSGSAVVLWPRHGAPWQKFFPVFG